MSADRPPRKQTEKAGRRIRKAKAAGHEPSPDDIAVVDSFRVWHLPTVLALQGELTGFLHAGDFGPEDLPITSRPKSLEAILAKLCRTTTALPRMQDIAGARIVVPGLEVQHATRAAIEILYDGRVEKVTDTTEEGDQWGYRAVHVVVGIDGRLAEIQIRTTLQDRWAQVVEAVDKARGLDLKHGRGPADWIQWFWELSDEFRKGDEGKPVVIPPSPIDLLPTEQA